MAVHLLSSAAASPDFLHHLMQSDNRAHRCSKQPQNPSDSHSMFRLAVYFSNSIIFFFSRTAVQLIYSNIFIISIFPKLFIQQRLSVNNVSPAPFTSSQLLVGENISDCNATTCQGLLPD